jgi:RES domain-containing protein
MLAWRLCREPFADLTGEGARRFGGRWNTPGRALIYAAASASLAVLEVRVHLDLPPELLPDDYVLMTIDLGDAEIEDVASLPDRPHDIGDQWLRNAHTPVLRVPSLIVPESPNLLINPVLAAEAGIQIANTRKFTFDPRLWLPR